MIVVLVGGCAAPVVLMLAMCGRCGVLSPCAGGDISSERTAYEVVLPLKEDARVHGYLQVAAHTLVESVSVTRTVPEWHAEVVRVAQALRSLGLIGCNVAAKLGKLPYVAGWLARCLMLLKNHEAGVARLELGTATLKDVGAAFPDAGSVAFDLGVQLAGSAKRARTMLVADLFAALGYSGRPELFTMHCCFFARAQRWLCGKKLSTSWIASNTASLQEVKNAYRKMHGFFPMAPHLLSLFYQSGDTQETVDEPDDVPAPLSVECFKALAVLFGDDDLPADLVDLMDHGQTWKGEFTTHGVAGVLILLVHLKLPVLRGTLMHFWHGSSLLPSSMRESVSARMMPVSSQGSFLSTEDSVDALKSVKTASPTSASAASGSALQVCAVEARAADYPIGWLALPSDGGTQGTSSQVRSCINDVFPVWRTHLGEARAYHLLGSTLQLMELLTSWPRGRPEALLAGLCTLAAKAGTSLEAAPEPAQAHASPRPTKEVLLHQTISATCAQLNCSANEVYQMEPRLLACMGSARCS